MRLEGRNETVTRVINRALARDLGFVLVYLLLDWVSYQVPMFGANITPWNPEKAFAIVYWQHAGLRAIGPYAFALALGDVIVRGMSLDASPLLLANLPVLICYGVLGEYLRRGRMGQASFEDTHWVRRWALAVTICSGIASLAYVYAMVGLGRIPPAQGSAACVIEWIGESTGIFANMPLFSLMASRSGRVRLLAILRSPETYGYCALAAIVFLVGFPSGVVVKLHLFYVLLLPVIWAAAHQGLPGAAFSAFLVQVGLAIQVHRLARGLENVYELEILVGLFSLVGLFLGLVVEEQKRTMKKLRQTLHLAAASELTAALSHEMLQPLSAIAIYGAACRSLATAGGAQAKLLETIGLMVQESARAGDVVRKLREFFRTGTFHPEEVDIAALLNRAADAFEARAAERGVRLQVSVDREPRVTADPTHLSIVLRNLIANAFDAVESVDRHRRWITVSASRLAGGGVRVGVEDSGPGVSAEEVGKLFESFYSTKSSGLGLGLVMSRALVEAHGGRLWAEAGNHGVFKLELPFDGRDRGT